MVAINCHRGTCGREGPFVAAIIGLGGGGGGGGAVMATISGPGQFTAMNHLLHASPHQSACVVLMLHD